MKLEPFPEPRLFEKPAFLPGLWLEPMNGPFARIAEQIPRDQTICEIPSAVVLDYAAYVRGLLSRLSAREPNSAVLLQKLSQRHQDLDDSYSEHPLEVDVREEDIRKLVMMACILADAETIFVNRPVLGELVEKAGNVLPELRGSTIARHVWRRPRASKTVTTIDSRLQIVEAAKYCVSLEPYFQPADWHSGRVAVAIGAFLAYVLDSESGHGYLGLTTVFEALLSTDKIEIAHQVCERAAFMLETTEDARYALYRRMKKLYNTRSLLVHGAVENRKGVIKYDDLRLDAKITIIPDRDYADIFDLCIRLFRRVLQDEPLLKILDSKNSTSALTEYYLRLLFR